MSQGALLGMADCGLPRLAGAAPVAAAAEAERTVMKAVATADEAVTAAKTEAGTGAGAGKEMYAATGYVCGTAFPCVLEAAALAFDQTP